jgi:hypothetical protein
MAEVFGLADVISDLLIFLVNVSINETVFLVKTTIKGFINFLFDTLRYLEDFIKHLERLFKR